MTREEFEKLFGECPFEMVQQGYQFTDPEILKITNDANDWTVAHLMARKGHEFTDPEILKIANYYGWTVAHIMAARGYKFTDPEILKLVDKYGTTVGVISNK